MAHTLLNRTTATRENALTEEERDAFLSEKRIGRLASNRADGWSHVTPIWYVWEGGKFRLSLYFCMRDVEQGEAAELQGYRLEPVAPWHVRLTPYPLRDDAAQFSLVRRVIPKNGTADVLGTQPERVAITIAA